MQVNVKLIVGNIWFVIKNILLNFRSVYLSRYFNLRVVYTAYHQTSYQYPKYMIKHNNNKKMTI